MAYGVSEMENHGKKLKASKGFLIFPAASCRRDIMVYPGISLHYMCRRSFKTL